MPRLTLYVCSVEKKTHLAKILELKTSHKYKEELKHFEKVFISVKKSESKEILNCYIVNKIPSELKCPITFGNLKMIKLQKTFFPPFLAFKWTLIIQSPQKNHFWEAWSDPTLMDFTLNSDNNKEILSFGLCWPLLAFVGLHWPWMNF